MRSLATNYLLFVFAVSTFRVVMYIVRAEDVARVKIAKDAWEDPKVRELAKAWCNTIRLMMAIRAAVSLWGSYLDEGNMKDYLCLITFATDAYTFSLLMDGFRRKGGTIEHQSNGPPLFIQSSITLFGLAFVLHWIGLY